MRCERCGKDFPAGLDKCPNCGNPVHYGGKTEFYGKVASSKLTIQDLFSGTFKPHAKGAGARMFMAGTSISTPSPDRMLSEWEQPWLYARFLLAGLVFSLLSYFMYSSLGHPGGVFLLFTLGALVIPLGILVFYWEVNIPRDIPIYQVILIFFIGGVLSLIFAIMMPDVGTGEAYWAPLVEEPAKILALAIFVYLLDSKYIFGGLLIGAAVGAGFSAFENIYYVMKAAVLGIITATVTDLNIYGDVYFKDIYGAMGEYGSDLLIIRSLLTIGGHVTWAAIEGGALVMVKGGEKLQGKHFIDPRFLGRVAVVMGLHAVWNSSIQLMEIPLFGDVKYILLIAAAVYLSFDLIKRAIAQVLAVADTAHFRSTPAQPAESGGAAAAASAIGSATLTATAGPLAGAAFPFTQRVVIGRDPAICNVLFPPETAGVSRRHCTLERRSDGVYLLDESSAGTFWQNGQRIPKGQWVPVISPFYLGTPGISFSVSTSFT